MKTKQKGLAAFLLATAASFVCFYSLGYSIFGCGISHMAFRLLAFAFACPAAINLAILLSSSTGPASLTSCFVSLAVFQYSLIFFSDFPNSFCD